MMWTTALTLTAIVVIFLAIFFAVTHPAKADGSNQANKEIIMQLQDAANAVSGAAQSLNASATALSGAVDAIKAAVASGDLSALDQPMADLGAAVTAVGQAADAVKAALPA